MRSEEIPLVFSGPGGKALIGMAHLPGTPAPRGVVIVVGGPQYRVGSHRQFVLLARRLAARGVPVLRFDYRGMGDSDGSDPDFRRIGEDIAAAVAESFRACAGLREVVLWGLCDAASAALFYAPGDPRVAGLVLVNPWVRTDAGQARTLLRHYYLSRLLQGDFWRSVGRGEFHLFASLSSLAGNLRRALSGSASGTAPDAGAAQAPARGDDFPTNMLRGLQAFEGPVLSILSGDDLTAREFEMLVASSRAWQKALARPNVTHRRLEEANHTFSRSAWRDQVAAWTGDWLAQW